MLRNHIKKLESLILIGTPITDAGLSHLEDLPKLSVLSLAHTQVTDSGCLALERKRPGLVIQR